MSKKKPFPERPFTQPHFGQPEDCSDLVNQYGTYNIQPTAESENMFPMIAPGLPEQWSSMRVGKEEVEEQAP